MIASELQNQIDELVRNLYLSGASNQLIRRSVERSLDRLGSNGVKEQDQMKTKELVQQYVDKLGSDMRSRLAQATTTIALSNLVDEARGAA